MNDFSMKVYSDLRLEIEGEHESYPADHSLYLIGNLYGAFYGNKMLSKEETIEIFQENIKDISRTIEIVQSTAGNYYLMIKSPSAVHIICSSNTPGVFYRNHDGALYLTNIADDAYAQSSADRLEQTQLFNYVFSGHNIRSPFETFFSDIKRAPGGTYLSIYSGLKTINKIYVKQTYKDFTDNYTDKPDDEKYNLFKNTLDTSTKLIANGLRDKKVYLMVSGGADSVMMMTAFLRAGLKPVAINWQSGGSQGRWQDRIIERLSEEMGFEYKVITGDPYRDIQTSEDIENYYKEDLIEIFKNPYIQLHRYFEQNGIQDPIVFSGQNLDGLFEFFTTFKSSYIGLKTNPAEFLARRLCEITGTAFFFSNIIKYRGLFQLLIRRKIDHPYYDYLLSMSNNVIGFETQLPYAYLKTLNPGISDFTLPWRRFGFIRTEIAEVKKRSLGQINLNSIHLDIQEKTLVKRLLDDDDNLLLRSEAPLKKRTYLNHLVRLMKYLNAHQPFILKYTMMSRKFNYQLRNYGDQDFLRRFCLTYNRNSIKDLILPKRFKYRYINENLHTSTYKDIVKAAAIDTGWRRSALASMLAASKSTVKSILKSSYNKVFNRDENAKPKGTDLVMLKQVWARNGNKYFKYDETGENPEIRLYFRDIENRLLSGDHILDKNGYYEMERFVNLKVYLNEIISRQQQLSAQ